MAIPESIQLQAMPLLELVVKWLCAAAFVSSAILLSLLLAEKVTNRARPYRLRRLRRLARRIATVQSLFLTPGSSLVQSRRQGRTN